MPIILTSKHFPKLWGVDDLGRVPPLAVRSAALLRDCQRLYLAQNPAAAAPEEISTPVKAFIGNGAWRIDCRCNEAPHTDPEFGISCCFGCGAIYTNIVFPDDKQAIEDLLTNRPVQHHRNWTEKESVEDLYDEQVEHGDVVPKRADLGLPKDVPDRIKGKPVREKQ